MSLNEVFFFNGILSFCFTVESPRELPVSKKQKQSAYHSPRKNTLPRRRSSRLSPQSENKDQSSNNANMRDVTGDTGVQTVLKQHSGNLAKVPFTHQSKDFKVPSRNASTKLRRTSSETNKFKDDIYHPAQVLCPLRHRPREVCTICMSR